MAKPNSTIGLCAAMCLMLIGSPVAGQSDSALNDDNPARVRLITESRGASPGDTLKLGVSFDIAPDWHLYWNGRNDSGMPVKISLSLPEGWQAGEIQWPAPQRFYYPEGPILDHGYEEQLTLIVPIRVPESAEAGATNIQAAVEWLACREACIPGFAEQTLEVPIRAGEADAPPSKDAARFARARERHPDPWDGAGAERSHSWSGNRLILRVPAAKEISFYPAKHCRPLANKYADTHAEGDTLTLRFDPPDGDRTRVLGIVEARGPDGGPLGVWALDTAPPDAAAGSDPGRSRTGSGGR